MVSVLRKTLLALALLAISLPVAIGQSRSIKTGSPDKKTVAGSPFSVGERLTYDVSWADFIVAGELTLETRERRAFDGVDGYHISAEAQSVGLVSAVVYKVKDIYESFIDAQTLQPFRAQKRSRRGNKRREASFTIDQKNHTVRFADGRTMEVPADTYDLVGLLYAIRAMDLTPGKSRDFTLIEDNKLYPIKVEVGKSEKVTTRAGKYDAVKVTTKLTGGRETQNLYDLSIYITSDARRLPVLITAKPTWGDVRVELTSATATGAKPK
ncbi:MAG TPA: DUF3108 domain-containing protein [Blastocatellia bacterium]|nr:DUF3108 domain-containing protein [Blastocatellia bacterium]